MAFKWQGKEYSVRCEGEETVSDLKRRIFEETGVQAKRQ